MDIRYHHSRRLTSLSTTCTTGHLQPGHLKEAAGQDRGGGASYNKGVHLKSKIEDGEGDKEGTDQRQ